MQNARVIQLGSSGVKVTRQSASFEEAFGGYKAKKSKKEKHSSFDWGNNWIVNNPFINPAGYMYSGVLNALNPSATPTTSSAPNPLTANLPIVYDSPRDYILMPLYGSTTTNLLKVGGGTKAFPNNQPFSMVRAYKIYNGQPIEINLALMENGVPYLVPTLALAKDVLTGKTANLLPANPTGSTSSSPITDQSVIYDSPRNYKLINANGQLTPLTTNLLKVGGGTKAFPTNQPLSMVRAYKSNGGQITDVNLAVMENGVPYLVPNLNLAVDILTGMTANTLPANPTGSTSSYAETPTTNGIGTTAVGGQPTQVPTQSGLTQLLTTLTLEPTTRLTTNNPLMPLYQGFYKVVNDVSGKDDSGLTKMFLKDSIVEGYLQTFPNPTTGGKSGYFIVQSEVPTTVGNAGTTTQVPNVSTSVSNLAPSLGTLLNSLGTSGTATGTATTGGTATSVGTSSGTQSSPSPSKTIPEKQMKSSASGMIMKNFKLPLYALVQAPIGGTSVSLDPNQGGGANTGGGNYDPNQGGGVYTGGGSSSADLDALNAQIEAQQMAQYQQEGGGQQQTESMVNPNGNGSSYYIPTQDELMVDVDTNYAPDTDIESSFDGFSKSNAMETKINDLATKIAWNKEMAEMLKMKKGVDKTALKEEYNKKVARVNELLRELKGCETPANREYILKMIAECDMMRPSMKNKMKKDIVIQNANPKIIDLGNATPSEFKNDLGNTIMEDENSSFMGNVIEYSDFSGSSTTTALMGVGIGAVLGIIGIVVIKKMGK